MRLSKERIRHMAETLAGHLETDGAIALNAPLKSLAQSLETVITDELSIEDRLNTEVRQMLKAHEQEIERGHVDYQKMFAMLKQKLARERGVIL